MTNQSNWTATAALAREHRGIEKVVRVIETIQGDIEFFRLVEPSILADVTSFLGAFAYECQQTKEEAILYRWIEAKGIARASYLLATLAAEHRKAEVLAGELLKCASIYVSSGGARRGPLIVTLSDLVTLYRQHLWKEDHILLPMVDRVLTRADQDTLRQSFGHATPGIALDKLADGIERQSMNPPSHLGEVLV